MSMGDLARSSFDLDEIINAAAQLVDVDDRRVTTDYRTGVVELAAKLCLDSTDDDAVTVMGYAVHGVNRRQSVGGMLAHPPIITGSGSSIACPATGCQYAESAGDVEEWGPVRARLMHHIVDDHPHLVFQT